MTPSALRAWLRGLGAGIAAVGLLALASRLFPGAFEGTSAVSLAQLYPSTASRLNYPVQYWNALATLIALGLPCLLWAATTERRAVARAFALLPIPALAAALYLTSSRGGVAVSALGCAIFLALARSWRALAAVAVAGAASAPAAAVLVGRDALTTSPLAPGAASEGRSAALLIGALCVGGAVVYGLVSSARLELGRFGRPLGAILAGGAAVVVVAALVLVDPVERFERFKAVPSAAENETIQSHLASGSGNGRWQLWESAVDQFTAHKLKGEGAGAYEAWWAENGTLGVFVRDAHSLYLETLGELGAVGLLLLGAALLVGLAVGVSRCLTSDRELRAAAAALTGAYVAWLVEAGIDWIWETTVVTLVAVSCLALLTGPATARRPDALRRGGLGSRRGSRFHSWLFSSSLPRASRCSPSPLSAGARLRFARAMPTRPVRRRRLRRASSPGPPRRTSSGRSSRSSRATCPPRTTRSSAPSSSTRASGGSGSSTPGSRRSSRTSTRRS